MFGAINKLQILTHLPLLTIAVSANAWSFCASLVSLVNFELYDLGPLTTRVLRLHNDTVFQEGFADYGYGSKYFIINLGNPFYAFMLLIAGLFLLLILNKASLPRLLFFRDRLRLYLVWGSFINFFHEACLPMAISALIAFSLWSIKSFGEAVDQLAASIACVAVFIAVPPLKLWFLQDARDRL